MTVAYGSKRNDAFFRGIGRLVVPLAQRNILIRLMPQPRLMVLAQAWGFPLCYTVLSPRRGTL